MISIVIPTIRPQNIPRILEAIKTAVSYEHEVVWEEDLNRIGAPKMVNYLIGKAKYDWVVFLGDDTIPEENSIDILFKYAVNNNLLVVGFNDHFHKKGTHFLINKKVLESLENGQMFFEGYIHNFCDDELRVKSEKLGVYGWCEDAFLTHNHPALMTAPMDITYEKQLNRDNWAHDRKLFEERNCKLSVVMIVKNEEAMLAQCLASVASADEIIVVDTGSIDKTKEIAAQFTDKIYDFEWCDDFAKARNFALSKAANDWILSIDADEVMQQGGVEKLRPLLLTSKHGIGIKMTCETIPFYAPRVFRNVPFVQWKGKIHETIALRDYDTTDITITYGYSPAHLLDQNRNMRILEKAHAEDPSDTRTLFYLAREYAYYREWEKAEQKFEEYISKATWLPEKADAHFMLALCYWYDGKGNGEKTRENCLKAININAHFKAPILLMAHASFEKNAEQWKRMAETADNSGTLFRRERFDII